MALGILLLACLAGAQTVVQYGVLTWNTTAYGIAVGPDGNIWFTEPGAAQLGRITATGSIREFPVPSPNAPTGITAGPDGALWFVLNHDRIGRITLTGSVTAFPMPVARRLSPQISGITAGPDGNLWFAESAAGVIGRATMAGVITEFAIPTPMSLPSGITGGPDGNVWFTESGAGRIGRITPAGAVTEFPLADPGHDPGSITTGPDGNLWFTEWVGNRIGRITTSGLVTEFPIPTPDCRPGAISAGPDGAFWFLEVAAHKIGRIATDGSIREFPLTLTNGALQSIVTGPDGSLWFTNGNRIGRMGTGACLGDDQTLCLRSDRFRVTAQWSVPSQSEAGTGQAVPITSETGSFWFFSNANLEVMIKVLDGRSVNGRFWVFYGALTNVEYTLTVTDTQTRAVKTYFNPQGQLTSVADTGAF